MHVPDLTGLTNATDLFKSIAEANEGLSSDTEHDTGSEGGQKPKAFGRASALLDLSNNAPRSTSAKEEEQAGELHQRQTSCPSGQAFYRCSSGFTGCCSLGPCNSGQACPDSQNSSIAATEMASSQTAGAAIAQVRGMATIPKLASAHRADRQTTAMDTASLMTASPTMSMSMASAPTNLGTPGGPVPICPVQNGTFYTDNSDIQYMVHCNMENTFSSYNTISVGTGGYGECFSACSRTGSCAGFTFIGVDGGDCYLKNKMPATEYVNTEGSNYVSCMKVHPTAHAAAPSATPSSATHKSSVGAIAGGVIGGIAGLILLLFLIASCAKRRRAQIEQRRANTAITHIIQGPVETQQLPIAHQRQRSTSHDVFTPYGGSYYVPQHTRQRSTYRDHYQEQQWV